MLVLRKAARSLVFVLSVILCGAALGFLAFWVSALTKNPNLPINSHICFLSVVAMLATGSLGLWRIARAKTSGEMLQEDVRPPILFLRSFGDDRKFLVRKGADFRTVGQLFNLDRRIGLEDFFARSLSRLGPVVAIGKPGELLAPLGAGREYVGDDEWQDRVGTLIRQSQLILVFLVRTEGVRWEIETLLSSGAMKKVVLVLPPVRTPELMRRLHIFQTACRGRIRLDLDKAMIRSATVVKFSRSLSDPDAYTPEVWGHSGFNRDRRFNLSSVNVSSTDHYGGVEVLLTNTGGGSAGAEKVVTKAKNRGHSGFRQLS